MIDTIDYNILVIYHRDCPDGSTAAAVVLKRFPHARVYPLAHHYTPEELGQIMSLATPDTRLYTVDCVLGVREFLDAGYAVTTIDHHIGAQRELSDLADIDKNLTYIFDNDKSGASLTWSYLFPEAPIPEIVKFVEDADLWRWRYGDDTKHIKNYLFPLLNKPHEILPLLDELPIRAKEEGMAISRFADALIEQALLRVAPITVRIGEFALPAFNIVDFRSEIGNLLSEKNDCAVVLFNISGDQVHLSFRSKDGHEPSALDLSQIVGGKGHRNASGATVSLSDFIKMITME